VIGIVQLRHFSGRRLFFLHAFASNRSLVLLWKLILKFSEVQHVVEVGANKGEISKSFCEASTERSAWAFEANPFVFSNFTAVNVPANMKVYNLGMGSGIEKTMKLKVPIRNRSRNSGNGSFLEQVEHNDYQTFEVIMSTIDKALQENQYRGNFALWIDVEGFTLDVLLGASNALESKQVIFIFLEMESRALWKSGANSKVIDEYLKKFGYRRLARDFEYPGQFNCIYTNQKISLPILIFCLLYLIWEKFLFLMSIFLLPAEIVMKILKRVIHMNQKLTEK